MSAQKILCPNGHLLGVRDGDKLITAHRGRRMEITLPHTERLCVRFVCDRCGAEKTVRMECAPRDKR